MKSFTLLSVLGLASYVVAQANGGPRFDPAGAKNVGNGKGAQFIGGQCLSTADCASGCCAGPSGICSGVGAQTQAGKTGCGFSAGSSSLNNGAAPPAAASTAAPPPNVGGPPFDPAGVKNIGNGKGTQFIGGQCLSKADCASGCCAGPSGICSGVGAQTQAGKTGCGFVAGSSSLNNGAAAASPSPTAATPPPNVGGPAFDPAGVKNIGNGKGTQFIGGQCLSQADCASGCCAGPSGICSGIGAQTQAGKTGCGFVAGSSSLNNGATPPAATAPPPAPAAPAPPPNVGGPPFDPAGVKNIGNGKGTQFIGGQCLSQADCASGCCAGPSGICSGVGAQTQAGKTGCGFVAGSSSLTNGAAAASPPPAAAAPPPNVGGPAFDPAGVKNVGNGKGVQFIGGQCLSAADCASGCCAGPSGICSGVGAQTQAGKTGCGFISKRFVSRRSSLFA